MYGDQGHMDGGWGVAMVFVVLGLWVLIALAVAWFIRSSRLQAMTPVAKTTVSAALPTDARHILDERLARGDIELDDYQARSDALRD